MKGFFFQDEQRGNNNSFQEKCEQNKRKNFNISLDASLKCIMSFQQQQQEEFSLAECLSCFKINFPFCAASRNDFSRGRGAVWVELTTEIKLVFFFFTRIRLKLGTRRNE